MTTQQKDLLTRYQELQAENRALQSQLDQATKGTLCRKMENMNDLITVEPRSLSPVEIAAHRANADELLAFSVDAAICLRTRISELSETYRKMYRGAQSGWRAQLAETDRQFFKDVENELTAHWNRGLRSISVTAHDEIVRQAGELADLRREELLMRWELSNKAAELSRLAIGASRQ